jgi:hypothetical protein
VALTGVVRRAQGLSFTVSPKGSRPRDRSFFLMAFNGTLTIVAFAGVIVSISPLLSVVTVLYAAAGSYMTCSSGARSSSSTTTSWTRRRASAPLLFTYISLAVEMLRAGQSRSLSRHVAKVEVGREASPASSGSGRWPPKETYPGSVRAAEAQPVKLQDALPMGKDHLDPLSFAS